ncbi:zinc transporter ZIP3 [Clonorchis sinensis]|uniref:Zinc transporter ZIP3 n=1 Tax=Clonorchis sinensis TaxID=79923 RepID=H2KQP0_CLOSI|nr:zinc transporter ZIP3 [Clonorchis sinensis]
MLRSLKFTQSLLVLYLSSVAFGSEHGVLHGTGDRTPLTGGKLGLAAVMFFYSFLACSLPVLIVHCIDRKEQSAKLPHGSYEETDGLLPKSGCFSRFWTPERRTKIISRSNCLAAGALLSVGFLDVFIDTIECFNSALAKADITTDFPLASFVTLLGFFLILGVEQVTLEFFRTPGTDVPMQHQDGSAIQGAINSQTTSQRSSIRQRTTSLTAITETVAVLPEALNFHGSPMPEFECLSAESEHQGHYHHQLTVMQSGWIRVLILLCAISLHSVFEGMALGLTKSFASLLTLFAALSMHKIIIAISIGINLVSETTRQSHLGNGRQNSVKLYVSQVAAILTFSGASPLGTLIGWAVTNHSGSTSFLFIEATLQGLACGTFCYVVFCELLTNEIRDDSGDKLGKFLFLVIGWALVALVIVLSPAGA